MGYIVGRIIFYLQHPNDPDIWQRHKSPQAVSQLPMLLRSAQNQRSQIQLRIYYLPSAKPNCHNQLIGRGKVIESTGVFFLPQFDSKSK